MVSDTNSLMVSVRFPDGVRDVPAFNCPDHAMYAGMPGEYIITPKHIPGYKTERNWKLEWIATAVEIKPAWLPIAKALFPW